MEKATLRGRAGAFAVLEDEDGRRHAIRLGAVLGLSDGDDARGTTVLHAPGNRVVVIDAPLEDVLAFFGQPGPPVEPPARPA